MKLPAFSISVDLLPISDIARRPIAALFPARCLDHQDMPVLLFTWTRSHARAVFGLN